MTNPLNHQAQALKQSSIRATTIRCKELGGINLGQGVCNIPMQDSIKQAACEAIHDNKNMYDDYRGVKALREALAKKIERFNQVPVDPDKELMITHGATGGFVTALQTLTNPGDEIILFEPFYGYHREIANLYSLTLKSVPLNLEDLSFSLDELKQAITPKTKAIIICTPNNPTGKVFSKEELQSIGQLAKAHDFYVITDEMYEHFTYPGFEHTSIASLEDFFNRTITISGFSKVFNMTGWRLGYAYGPEAIIRRMSLVHDLLYICPVTPLQHAALEALNLPDSYYDNLRGDFLKKRDLMVQGLRERGFTLPEPQGAYYLFADAKDCTFKANAPAHYLLEEAKVAVVPGNAFYLDNTKGQTQMRFCFALELDELKQALKQLSL